jgi:DNA-directed RNA polymerase subunit RPC12/RpoP
LYKAVIQTLLGPGSDWSIEVHKGQFPRIFNPAIRVNLSLPAANLPALVLRLRSGYLTELVLDGSGYDHIEADEPTYQKLLLVANEVRRYKWYRALSSRQLGVLLDEFCYSLFPRHCTKTEDHSGVTCWSIEYNDMRGGQQYDLASFSLRVDTSGTVTLRTSGSNVGFLRESLGSFYTVFTGMASNIHRCWGEIERAEYVSQFTTSRSIDTTHRFFIEVTNNATTEIKSGGDGITEYRGHKGSAFLLPDYLARAAAYLMYSMRVFMERVPPAKAVTPKSERLPPTEVITRKSEPAQPSVDDLAFDVLTQEVVTPKSERAKSSKPTVLNEYHDGRSHFRCPGCRQQFSSSKNLSGKEITCPKCGIRFHVN